VHGTCDNADKLDGQHGDYYLDRANHTGTQLRSTISDFQHELSGAEHTGNLPESKVTFDTVNGHNHDGVNSKLITHVGSADDADKLDGQHGSYYLNRANHTGTQTRSTISDFAHKDTHKTGGSDAFTSTDEIEAIVKRIKESGGTVLALGSVADGKFLKRSGTSIIGADPPSGGGGVQMATYFTTTGVAPGLTEVELASVTITTTTNPVKIEFMVKVVNVSAEECVFTFRFYRDGSEINSSDRPSERLIPNAEKMVSIHSCDTPPSAGSHTYAIRVVSSHPSDADRNCGLRRLTVIAS
jgi:hypothetical protein